MWRCGVPLPRGQGGRRCVMLAMMAVMVLFLHLLVHRRVVEPFTFLRLRNGVVEDVLGPEPLQVNPRGPATATSLSVTAWKGDNATTQSTTTTTSHPTMVKKGNKVTTQSTTTTTSRPTTVKKGNKATTQSTTTTTSQPTTVKKGNKATTQSTTTTTSQPTTVKKGNKATTQSTTTTTSRPTTVKKGSKMTTRSTTTSAPRPATVNEKIKATTVKKENPFKNQVILNEWPPKVKFPLMLFNNPGRLGNRLNSYAVALTFHAAHNATATTAVTRDSMNQLVTLLDTTRLTLPVVDGNLVNEARKKGAHVSVGIPSWKKNDMISHLEPAYQRGEKEYRETGKPKMYSLEGYPNRMYLLAGHHDTIRAAFRFKEDLKQKIARFLEGVRERRGRRDITFVGFHIRRTDYTYHMERFFKCSLPGPAFYQSALNHYRATLRNPVFVVASDDLSYARQHLNTSTDVEFTDMKTAAEDMVLLGSCSHSIMTVGTFGFWASFFAGGQVVYPLITNCTLKPFVHPDHLGPRGYENWKAFDVGGGGPV
ncbi:uncharacterized protein LOC126988037 isoform X12 [Eriocheir sinensis]|uniref:uncharacterized protein LOC126988037 isoform X12 n=1 Tax=Eriocheir sinensis TaxID=95602 RepID=UPI0021C7D4B7|nr:uncharacterized protein LOC126988037 isoform X12 [Eriocheir sinensis]